MAAWGTQAWSEDLVAARDQALAWLASTAAARGWSAYWSGTVEAFVAAAYQATDGWWSDDIPAFWSGLGQAMADHAAALRASGNAGAIPAGWDKLAESYAAAGGATLTVEAGRSASSAVTIAAGTVSATAGEVGEVIAAGATAAKAGVSLFKSPWAWGLAALGLAGLAWANRGRR